MISLSTDLWTANNSTSYCAITFHYIDNNWDIVNRILDIILFPHPHTGDNIFKYVLSSLEDFKLSDKIISITHDNGSNEIKAVQMLQEYYQIHYSKILYGHRCVAHIINLIVKVGLHFFEAKLEKIENIVNKLHSSPKFMQSYKAICGATLIPLAVKTRWNSKYLMISAINKNIDSIHELSDQGIIGEDITPTFDEYSFFLELEKFLLPFYQITVEISTHSPTIGMTLLFFNDILENLKNHTVAYSNLSIKEAATIMLKKAEEYSHNIFTPYNYAASLLDPRIKNTLITILKDDVADKYLDIFKINFAKYTSEPMRIIFIINNISNYKTISLMQGLKKRKGASNGTGTNDNNQLTTYLNEPLAPEITNILDWWRGNADRFPHLAMMARDYLCQQTTSVASERAFSLAGNIMTKLRNRMAPSMLKQCMSLSSWDIDIMSIRDEIWQ
ncbi:unnamed protein product [Gordionus sp. m RMFG-2023]